MFGMKKKTDEDLKAMLTTLSLLDQRIDLLENAFKELLARTNTLQAKADKYDESVNQAMNMLRSLPGMPKP